MHAALGLIAEQGLSSVTMVSVAKAAGVARQTLYNHYRSVDEIVAAATKQHNDESVNQLYAAIHVVEDPVDKIAQLIKYVAKISVHPDHTLESKHSLPPDVKANLDGFDRVLIEQISETLQQGVASGVFRSDLVLDVDVALFRHLLNGVSSLVASAPADAARIVTDSTRTALAALQPTQAS